MKKKRRKNKYNHFKKKKESRGNEALMPLLSLHKQKHNAQHTYIAINYHYILDT